MGFIHAYKRLEKLCGDALQDERKISAYIDEMASLPDGSRLVTNWDRDLKQLKHYRWMRNQIVHDPDCTEEMMCEPSDTQWIEEFYARIINRTDPLALYRKAKSSTYIPGRHGAYKAPASSPLEKVDASKRARTEAAVCCAGIVCIVVCFLIWLLMRM